MCDALNGCVGKSWQDVGEVVAHGDFEAAAAFDHGENSGYTRSGLSKSEFFRRFNIGRTSVRRILAAQTNR